MNYEDLVESRKSIGDMSKEELFTYCYGLLEEVWNFEKEIGRLTAESTEWESKFYDEAKKIGKAIEYIENCYGVYLNCLKEPVQCVRKDNLLEILKGEDDE